MIAIRERINVPNQLETWNTSEVQHVEHLIKRSNIFKPTACSALAKLYRRTVLAELDRSFTALRCFAPGAAHKPALRFMPAWSGADVTGRSESA